MVKALLLLVACVPTIVGSGKLNYCPIVIEPVDPVAVQEKCLATMVYGEARGESVKGQVAVAYTALNRAKKAANKTVCDVVLAPKQYNIFNDNPALYAAAISEHIEPEQKNEIDQQGWEQAVKVAQKVLKKAVVDPTNGATHYIADKVMKAKDYKYPKWSLEYRQVAEIGGHRFFIASKKVKNV